MRNIMNAWRADHDSWMDQKTKTKYWACKEQQDWHGVEKQAFSRYLHQLSGCKFLLRVLVELPLISKHVQDDPNQVVLNKFLARWADFMKTDAYKNRGEKRSTFLKRIQ